MSDDLKKRINHIIEHDLEKLSNEELRALKQMILFLDIQDNYNNNVEETKTR